MSKIYTKSGDEGLTGLLSGGRVFKDDLRIEAYGTIDELNAVLGTARALELPPSCSELVEQLQDDLFAVGSALADPNPQGKFHSVVTPEYAVRLEREIDAIEADLPPLTQFILPGGTAGAAQLHLARTVCRRAERLVVRLGRTEGEHVPTGLLVYLNRLSDFLFVLARYVNHQSGQGDVHWSGL